MKQVLNENGIDDVPIFRKVNEIINKTFLSVESIMRLAFIQNVPFR